MHTRNKNFAIICLFAFILGLLAEHHSNHQDYDKLQSKYEEMRAVCIQWEIEYKTLHDSTQDSLRQIGEALSNPEKE